MEENFLNDIAVCIMVAWLAAIGARLLKQPLVLAYLLAGYLAGPMALNWIKESSIDVISEIGLILLLFMIGLEIDLKKILRSGKLISVTAFSQIIGCWLSGWGLFYIASKWMGGGTLDSLYLAIATALSSTVIAVKLLHDKHELDTLAGHITLGVLVLQDLFAILFLAVQPNLQNPALNQLGLSLARVVSLMAFAFVVSRYALPLLFRAVARLPELVLVGALSWCFLVAGLASLLDLSREMGALIAGVAISTFPYALDVTAKVTSLRDFFVTLFFVGLGMAIPAPKAELIWCALAVMAFLAFSRFVFVFPPLYWMKQGTRVGSLVSINLCQVSEFSLVILALGLKSKHISAQSAGIMSYAFAFMAVVSTYAITYSDPLVRIIQRMMKRLGIADLDNAAIRVSDEESVPDIFLLGCYHTASSLIEEMRRQNTSLLERLRVIDFNPGNSDRLRALGIKVIYGDISQPETLSHAGIEQASIIVCSLPNTILKGTNNLKLLRQLRTINTHAQIIVHADNLKDVSDLYAAGAGYVTVPRLLEANELFEVILDADKGQLVEKRSNMQAELKDRHEVLP